MRRKVLSVIMAVVMMISCFALWRVLTLIAPR